MRRAVVAFCLLAAVAVFALALRGMGEPTEKLVWDGSPVIQPGHYWGKGGSVRYGEAGDPLLVARATHFSPGTFAGRYMW